MTARDHTSGPLANVAVCGRFHFHHYVRYLNDLGGLNRFYYAARLSSNARALGLPRSRAVNSFAKEYLGALHTRLLGDRLLVEGRALYHDLWQITVLMRWRPAPILHHLLHGNGRMLIRRARRDGALVVGQPVNSHPNDLRQLINEEHERLGIASRLADNVIDRRLAGEARQCDYLIAASNVIKESYVNNGFPAHRIFILPLGVDVKRFSPLSDVERAQRVGEMPDSRFRVISVGKIIPRKGHVYLLEAWKRLRLARADLVLIGRLHPSMRPILDQYQGLFQHVPHVPHRRLRHYLGASHVFVLPSIEDGFAMVCNEAMACGLPVITTVNTGAGEVLEQGKDGFVVPIRSAEAIAEKLERLYRDEEMRRAMGASALDKARSDLPWSEYAKKVHVFHREMVSTRP